MKKIYGLLLTGAMVLCAGTWGSAATNLTITPTGGWGGVIGTQVSDAEMEFEKFPNQFFSKNDRVIPSAFAMTNTMGYPNGKSVIKPFPHFEIGVAAGAGVWGIDRKDDYTDDNPVVPFAGANGGIHIGTGINDRVDITLKFFSLGLFYDFDEKFDDTGTDTSYSLKFTKSDVYSVGAKIRYNLAERQTLVPILFSFGGISVNLGLDYMKGNWKADTLLSNVQQITFGTIPVTEDVRSTTAGAASIDWNFISVTPEIFVYADILYLFSIYTGPSLSFNVGEFNFDMDQKGDFRTVSANTQIATVAMTSRNTMKPYMVIPKWTLGLEINLWVLKLQVESAAVLTDIPNSGMVQAGVRIQI